MVFVRNKVALITGGATGIGLAYAKEFLTNGAKGVCIADIDEETGQDTVFHLNETFGENRAVFVQTDVTNEADFQAAFEKTLERFHHVDILVNNAGILNDIVWKRQIDINITGTIIGTLLAVENYLQHHRSGKEGVVVNISSIVGLDPFPSHPVYCATKHAVIGLTRSFGHTLHHQRTGVRVVSCCPGATETTLTFRCRERTFGPDYLETLPTIDKRPAMQTTKKAAEALLDVIENGESGSVWLIEDGEKAREIEIPHRSLRLKK